MNGIEILNTMEVAVDSGFNITAALITLFIIIIIGTIFAIREDEVVIISFATLIGIILALGMGYILADESKTEIQYQVTISDEVSMNDFMEKYEIVNIEGKIYTVKEKEK